MRPIMVAALGAALLTLSGPAASAPTTDIRSYLSKGLSGTLTAHHDAGGGTIEITLASGQPLVATYGGPSFDVVAGWKAAADKAGTPRKMTISFAAKDQSIRATDVATGTQLRLSGMVSLNPIDLGAEACVAQAKDFPTRLGCLKLQLATWQGELQRAAKAGSVKHSEGLKEANAAFAQFGAAWDGYVTGEMEKFDDSANALDYYERRVNLTRQFTLMLLESEGW